MMTPRKMLGLAVSDRSIVAVEVGTAHGRRRVLHAAEFPLPEGDAAQDQVSLGPALRQFLRQNHFSASRCVLGLNARWLVAKEKLLPPTTADLIPGLLAITSEREFASDPKDLICDYSGPIDTAQGQAALLVAAPRRNVDQLVATAEAAGLRTVAVTSSTLSLAAATSRRGDPAPWRVVLHLAPSGTEVVVQSGTRFRLLRRLSIPSPMDIAGSVLATENWLNDLAGELHRVLALLPDTSAAQERPELLIWNACGLSAGSLGTLGDQLSLATRVCGYPADLGIAEAPPSPPGEKQRTAGGGCATIGEFAAAAALTVAGLTRQTYAVDFLHSRLSPRKKLALKGKIAWASGVAAAALIGGAVLFIGWQRDQQEIEDLRSRLEGMRVGVATAKEVVDKTAFARGWYDRRPKFLDSLRELTLAFPLEGKIWATSLAISDDMRAMVSGKAADEAAVLEVLDRLKGSPKFTDVKPLYIREVGGGTQDVSFAISLSFVVKAEGS